IGGGDSNPMNNTVSDVTTVRRATAVSLSTSPNPSTLGQAVTLTANVSAGSAQVSFYDGGILLDVASLAGGQATISTTQLTAGAHTLTARYSGDAAYGPVTSEARMQVVNALPITGAQRTSYAVGNSPWLIARADFNRDGNIDLIIGNDRDLSLLMGNGN